MGQKKNRIKNTHTEVVSQKTLTKDMSYNAYLLLWEHIIGQRLDCMDAKVYSTSIYI